MTDFIETPSGRRIAYRRREGQGPGLVFLSGFKSDMAGTKAVHLEAWAEAKGYAFLRFDYSGHGQSSGAFTDGSIGQWAEDAQAAIEMLTTGPQILVGSSMGGWISLLLAKAIPERVAGMVGIAVAPDFTEDSMWAGFDAAQRRALVEQGQISLPSDYDEPYVITRKLIEEGRKMLVLRDPLRLDFPVRLLHGLADQDVALSVPLHLIDHAQGDDIQLRLVKGADHRFSSPECLALMENTVEDVRARI